MARCENLKAGDKVFVWYSGSCRLDFVEKVTPKGFIKVSGTLFTKDGFERGSSVWYRTSIEPATEEMIAEYNKEKFIRATIKQMHETLEISYDQALKISKILNKQEETNNESI